MPACRGAAPCYRDPAATNAAPTMAQRKRQKLNLREIAALAGTSKSSVSRVLTQHPHVAPATRARIERVIRKHGFSPNPFARGLAGGRTGLVAAIASEINSGFYAEVLKGIDQVVSRHHGHVLSSFAHEPGDYIAFWQQASRRRQVDGIILIAPPMEIFRARVRPDDLPAVVCAARPPDGAASGWDRLSTATVTNREGMTALLETLLGRGVRRMVYLAGPGNVYDANERRAAVLAFAAAHAEASIEVIDAGHTRQEGLAAAAAYLRAHDAPQAFVCFNDATGYGALQALREAGWSREQVLVTGCDDEPPAAVMAMTTLRMPMPELGQLAAEMLLESIAGKSPPRHAVVNLELTWRANA